MPLNFRAQSVKKTCLRFAILNLHIKVTEHFLNRIKKIWSDRTKIAPRKKNLEIKIPGYIFSYVICFSNLRAIEQILFDL